MVDLTHVKELAFYVCLDTVALCLLKARFIYSESFCIINANNFPYFMEIIAFQSVHVVLPLVLSVIQLFATQ